MKLYDPVQDNQEFTNDGEVYVGELKDNLKHGKGKLKYKNGDIYEGEFKND